MNRRIAAWVPLALLAMLVSAHPASAQKELRVGWCARTVSSAAAPFAVATKMGWFAEGGISVRLVPLPGSTDCVKFVATREVNAALPSVEPLAIIRLKGVKMRVFYTAYQGNIYGIAVPRDSAIRSFQDLKGKRVGVISMASGGVLVARALASAHQMDPDKDIKIVVAGEGAQTAAMLRSGQVDALSQFDTQYAMVTNAGMPLRRLDTRDIDRFPSNGFIALEEHLESNRAELVALARGYAKGTIFAIANPEAAVRILWEVFPQTRATGKSEADAMRDDEATLTARAANWRLERVGARRWGENVEANYEGYMQFLKQWGVIPQPVAGADVITNDFIGEINAFDADKVAADAKAYRYR